MGFLSLAQSRSNCRSFTDRKVEQSKLDLILEAAKAAPVGTDRQDLKLIIVCGEEGHRRLAAGSETYGAPLYIIVFANMSETWLQQHEQNRYAGGVNASIVTDHMMLQAVDLGLDAVWISRFNGDIIGDEFEMPLAYEAVSILAVGYGTKEHEDWLGEEERTPLNQVEYETM